MAGSAQKNKGLSREQAAELYRDLQKAMGSMKSGASAAAKPSASPKSKVSGIDAKAIAASISAAMKRDDQKESATSASTSFQSEQALPITKGQYAAIVFVLVFAIGRVAISAMEAAGVGSVNMAEAAIVTTSQNAAKMIPAVMNGVSREEVKILTALDGRRAELEERSKQLDDRQSDIEKRDREFAVRLTQLRELTEKLSNQREQNDKKRSSQLEQLANVYSSMNPPEAAALIEQLDISIAIGLLERMPEKRIGQILALMNSEKALQITRLLSARTN